jgi:hypothetical protein
MSLWHIRHVNWLLASSHSKWEGSPERTIKTNDDHGRATLLNKWSCKTMQRALVHNAHWLTQEVHYESPNWPNHGDCASEKNRSCRGKSKPEFHGVQSSSTLPRKHNLIRKHARFIRGFHWTRCRATFTMKVDDVRLDGRSTSPCPYTLI